MKKLLEGLGLHKDPGIVDCNLKVLMELIQNGHNRINSIYLMDVGCALGVHAGPGSLAAAIQPAS